ncbi:hypothetical protein JYT91_00415 [archaeon AH-315-M20]|nr:hypothetical protein [archaeon AH-315-M20]
MKIQYFENDEYEKTESMYSLSKTEGFINDDILLLDSDILYDGRALIELINHPFDNMTIVNPISGSGDEVFICMDKQNYLTNLGKNISNKEEAIGEFVGISKLSLQFLKQLYATAKEDYSRNELRYHCETCMFKTSKKNNPVKGLLIGDLAWTEIDNEDDLKRAIIEVHPKIKRTDSDKLIGKH